MDDQQIIELYWKRDESALNATSEKYEPYLLKIAWNILNNREDCEESINDTYLRAWNSMPPQWPELFRSYLSSLARRASIDLLRHRTSAKRFSEYTISLSELEDCISDRSTPQEAAELHLLAESIQRFLDSLSDEKRRIFVCRYYFMDSVQEIAAYSGYSKSKIKSALYRMRQGLRSHLEKEGFAL